MNIINSNLGPRRHFPSELPMAPCSGFSRLPGGVQSGSPRVDNPCTK